ncbi:MAG: hypothetical protein LBK94_00720 [Prevotellaceae bacterium]|jgi:hypothetical protein|nr:hypothetical protein [Prevotellaceae bacterium]
MAWITTDTDVASTLIVDKIVNGQHVQGYPRTYFILNAFALYAAISVNEWHKMNYYQRENRINDFKAYVESIENIDIDSTQTNEVMQPSSEQEGEIVEI